MLYIIGLGLKPKDISIEGLDALKNCEKNFLESYTSQYATGTPQELEVLIGKNLIELNRKQVEEEFKKEIEEAKTKNIALCIYGNPLNATTHLQVILDAKKLGVETKLIAGLSIFEYVAFTGLERYKFGKTTSIVFHEDGYEPESFYDAILENKSIGLHTLCLLDIKMNQNKMMSIRQGLSLLEMIEEKREKNILNESIIIGIAGMGSENQQVKAGTLEQIKEFNFSIFPQSLIVCGKLNEKEIEALKEICDLQ